MKIVDAFIFYNEINMLTYRLNVLNDVVDLFVIVEANQTFTGKPKPLFFKENAHLFEKFADKIVHHVVDLPFANPNPEMKEQWENEWHQRNSIQDVLARLTLQSNDIICISDVDEIIDPTLLAEIRKGHLVIDDTYSLNQPTYYYNLNTRHTIDFFSALITSLDAFYKNRGIHKVTVSGLRSIRHRTIWNAGWHLSFFGDASFIRNKLQTYAHLEHNIPENTDITTIETRVRTFKEPMNRSPGEEAWGLYFVSIKDNKNLPPQYERYLRGFYK